MRGRGAAGKTPVIGIVERGGNVRAKVVQDVKISTLVPNIVANVESGSIVCTDEWQSYNPVAYSGYVHVRVNHGTKEYVRAFVHTNTIEGFWSQLKRSINGTFHFVSKRHLQKYVNEFVYRYNRRKSVDPIFFDLSGRVAERHA